MTRGNVEIQTCNRGLLNFRGLLVIIMPEVHITFYLYTKNLNFGQFSEN